MLRAAKAQKKQTAKVQKPVQKKAATEATRKVTKRTMVTKRASTPSMIVPQQQPQTVAKKSPSQILAKPVSFISTFHKKSTPSPIFTPTRLFGGHAVAPPAPVEYKGIQVTKYGKNKRELLFHIDSDVLKSDFVPISLDGSSYENRPVENEMTPQELIAKFAVVLVDRDVAVCDGTHEGPHPREFIQVHTSFPKVPQICKYCGTRFLKRSAWDGSVVAVNPEH